MIEQAPAWGEGSRRGAVAEGTAGARPLGRFRLFRYEVRRSREVIEHYCEAFPEHSQLLEWLLRPRRHSLLSELGRVAQPRSGDNGELRWTESNVALLIEIALELAERQPSTKDGIAVIRARRKRARR